MPHKKDLRGSACEDARACAVGATGPRDDRSLGEIVDSLCARDCDRITAYIGSGRRSLPSREVLFGAMESLRAVLFPGYYGVPDVNTESIRFHVGATLDEVSRILREQIRRGLCFSCEEEEPERCALCDDRAEDLVYAFFEELPRIQRSLEADVLAAFEADPAATSPDEAIFCYPGITAITNYRLAHALSGLGVPLLPRMLSEQAHAVTGIDIHPGASIGESFFIDHGTGVVIGETTIIGDRVRLYQGVTLGAKSFPLDDDGNPMKGIPRHPIIEDDVVIYSGATILGRVTIGKGSVIGGNVWLTRSVEPNSRITQARAHRERFEGGAGI